MDTFEIDLLNPKAKVLLENLEDLNLIRIKKTKKIKFILEELRKNNLGDLTYDDITKEVESVRAERYEKNISNT